MTPREIVRAYALFAIDGERGRPETDPTYIQHTEGRDQGAARAGYSSCGDLVHGMWYRVGVRAQWCNRAANGTYQVGANISKIAGGMPSLGRRTFRPGSQLGAGDALIIWNKEDSSDAHTFVVLEHDRDDLVSADYGQPGGAMRRRTIEWRNIGGVNIPYVVSKTAKTAKRIRVWAPLDSVIDVARASGKWVEPERSDTIPSPPPDEDDVMPLKWDRTLRLGCTGPDVADLQARLNAYQSAGLKADGVYGPASARQVQIFERDKGLDADGMVGALTWMALREG